MKFDPKLTSVIIALNLETPFADIDLIKTFYTGDITSLVGFWKYKRELSYQLEMEFIDHSKMPQALLDSNQEEILFLNGDGGAFLVSLEIGSHMIFLGTMKEVKEAGVYCTHCPETNTYWKAIL